jgi:putative oxidoreductase
LTPKHRAKTLTPIQGKSGEKNMAARNLARTLVLFGILAVTLSIAWWAVYYNELIGGAGAKAALPHPMRCLLWTAEICVQPQAAAKVQSIRPYTPLALWGALVVLLLGLFVVNRTISTQPYPATPQGEPGLIISKLEPFYAWVRDLSWPLIRIAAGGTLLAHGLAKVLVQDVATFAARSMAGRGLEPALPLAYIIYFLETGGAVMIMLGLFTRLVAPMIAIQFFIITFMAHFANGYGWTSARGGWEYPLMWGVIFLAIALRGGGPYSLDRLLRREI